MEIVNRVDKHVKHKVEQILDNCKFLIEVLRLFKDSGLFVLNRTAHHKDLESCFLYIERLNLFFVEVNVPAEVLHFPDKELVTLDRLENGFGLFKLELENVIH